MSVDLKYYPKETEDDDGIKGDDEDALDPFDDFEETKELFQVHTYATK